MRCRFATAVVDATGMVVERYAYDPYGRLSGPVGQPDVVLATDWSVRVVSSYSWIYLHQGGRLDSAVGLYDFRNREYSLGLGRWIQQDHIGLSAGDNNLYGYVVNDPIIHTDPLGLQVTPKPNDNHGQGHVFISVAEEKAAGVFNRRYRE
jgi:RHS repeat-associated protein